MNDRFFHGMTVGQQMREEYERRVDAEPHLRDKARTILANARVLAKALGFPTDEGVGGALGAAIVELDRQIAERGDA